MPLRICPVLLVLMVPVAAHAAEQCRPDCTHQTKACVCAIDGRDVTVTAIGGLDRNPLRVGQALDPGDEVASADQNAVVALTCPKSSSVNLHGRFRSVIMPPAEGQDCALNLLAGSANVQSSTPTQVSAGTTLMGSKRTTYGMRVASDATIACVVFEGEVEVRNLQNGVVRALGTMTWASWRAGALQQFGAQVTQSDLASTARVYARAETARARALGAPAADLGVLQRELEALHSAVLAKPDDPSARITLAGLQARARLTTPALYHLNLAERRGSPTSDQAAAIAATRWVAYKQVGREQEATGEAEKLRTLDPKRYEVLRQIEAKQRAAGPGQLRITAVATPQVVGAGQPAGVSVTVTTPDGQPVSGANVTLSAGGGTFARGGQPRIDGVTGADGAFRVEWRCQPCAAEYQIDVEVSGGRLSPQRTTVTIHTR